MAEPDVISLDEFRVLVKRARLSLNDEELEHLKPMYEHFVRQIAPIHELDLDVEDLAMAFSPNWDPQA